MWKDFFYFSKSERRAVLFLLTLLFVFICMWVLFPVKEEETLEQDQEGIEEIKNFDIEIVNQRKYGRAHLIFIKSKAE